MSALHCGAKFEQFDIMSLISGTIGHMLQSLYGGSSQVSFCFLLYNRIKDGSATNQACHVHPVIFFGMGVVEMCLKKLIFETVFSLNLAFFYLVLQYRVLNSLYRQVHQEYY